ncbi:trypsin-like serine protease [Actinoplanes utahensis]|nr:esterase [Actinoplanes utahensis]
MAAAATVLPGAQPAVAIANGENARPGAYPFSVRLTMTGLPADGGGSRDSSCSGALIAPRWVITAGHCFRDASGQRVSRTVAGRTTAVIGRTEINSVAGYEADVVAVHQAGHTDVALAELADPVPGITPIRLATTPPEPGEVLRLTGFGLVDGPNGIGPAERMQTGRFVVGAVGDTLLEASGHAPRQDTSPCRHDSGGPYFRESRDREPVLVALVSTGPGCPHPGPDMSARVDNLAEWITATTTERTGPPWSLIGTAALLIAAGLLGGLTIARRARR